MMKPVPQHPAAPSQRLTLLRSAEEAMLLISSGNNSKNMTFSCSEIFINKNGGNTNMSTKIVSEISHGNNSKNVAFCSNSEKEAKNICTGVGLARSSSVAIKTNLKKEKKETTLIPSSVDQRSINNPLLPSDHQQWQQK